MKRDIIIGFLLLLSCAINAQVIGPANKGEFSANLYGIVSNGSDQSANFTAAIAALPVGGTLILERGKTYIMNAQVIINKAMTLNGNGAKINYTGPTAIPGLAIGSSDVTIEGLTIYGTYASYIGGTHLIGTTGSSNTSFYSNITVKNCEVYNSQSSGLWFKFCRNVTVDNNIIHDMPYQGVGFYSVVGGRITNNIISDITALGQSNSNAYGITVQQITTDTVSRNVLIENNTINRVPWEGIDNHGGNNITVNKNTVLDCGVGIAIVGWTNGTSNESKVTQNHIQSTDYTSSGISIAGLSTPVYNTGVQVIGNTLVGQHIRLQETKGAIVSNNVIRQSGTNFGILLQGNGGFANNINLTIKDNNIIDVFTTGSANTYAIFMDDNNNTATITGNKLISGTGSGTNKNRYGFSTAAGSTGCEAYIGENDFSAATIAAYKSDGQFASRFLGSAGNGVATITTSSVYTVGATDKIIIYEYTTGGTTITLPAISKLNDDREIWITNLSGGTLTTSIAMYTKAATSSTTIAAGAKVHLTYDYGNSKIWRD